MACSDPVAILSALTNREVMFRVYTDVCRLQMRGTLQFVKGYTFKAINGRDSFDYVTFTALKANVSGDEITIDLRKGQSYI